MFRLALTGCFGSAALALGSCASLALSPPSGCYGVEDEEERRVGRMAPPPAVWLLSSRHGRSNETRFRLRLPSENVPTAHRYWARAEGGSIYIHIMGGMSGEHFWLHRTQDGYAGRYVGRTDVGEGADHPVRLRAISCGAHEWDDAGPLMRALIVSM
jgi:hypothetical protein